MADAKRGGGGRREKTPLLFPPGSPTHFARVNSPRACCVCLVLTELTQLIGEPKWRNVSPARRVRLPYLTGRSTSGRLEHRPLLVVTRLSEPTFCFSCKRSAKFCKEMKEKFAHPGGLGKASNRQITPGTNCHFQLDVHYF